MLMNVLVVFYRLPRPVNNAITEALDKLGTQYEGGVKCLVHRERGTVDWSHFCDGSMREMSISEFMKGKSNKLEVHLI